MKSHSHPWPEVIFREIVEHSAFGPRFSGQLYADEGNVATLRTTDISEDGRITYSTMPRAKIDGAQFDSHFLKLGDLVVTRSGRVGTAAVFEGFDIPVLPGAFLIRFRLGRNADPLFYRYYFNSRAGQQRLLSVAKGAAQQNLSGTNILGLAVPLVSLVEQRAIVDVLSGYDDLITNNRRRIELLEQSARELFKEWFVRLRYPGHEHDKVVDGVPEGWERMAASRAVFVNPKTQALKDKEIWYVPMAALSETGMMIDSSQLERRTVHTNVKFRQHDTLFARITPCLENGKTGYVDFLEEGDVACGSTEFIVLRGREVSAAFTYCLARSEPFRQLAIKSMTGSSGRQRVQEECFDKYPVLVAPKPIREMFDSLASSCFRQVATLRKQMEKLAKARDLLLPRLMDGRLTV